MTMHKALHPWDDVDRLYVSRKERGRGLASIEDSVHASIQRLADYIEKHEEGLITAIRNDTDNMMSNRMTITRKQKWEEKQLYGRFKRLINSVSHEKSRTWLRKGNFERNRISTNSSTKQCHKTNDIKARINKTQQNNKCRLCDNKDETTNHIIRECSKLTQKEYKTRHDWVGKMILWDMHKKFKFDHTNKCNMHKNDTYKLLWDFDIQTNRLISPRRPDLIIINKKENLQNCQLCCPNWPQNVTERKRKEG